MKCAWPCLLVRNGLSKITNYLTILSRLLQSQRRLHASQRYQWEGTHSTDHGDWMSVCVDCELHKNICDRAATGYIALSAVPCGGGPSRSDGARRSSQHGRGLHVRHQTLNPDPAAAEPCPCPCPWLPCRVCGGSISVGWTRMNKRRTIE